MQIVINVDGTLVRRVTVGGLVVIAVLALIVPAMVWAFELPARSEPVDLNPPKKPGAKPPKLKFPLQTVETALNDNAENVRALKSTIDELENRLRLLEAQAATATNGGLTEDQAEILDHMSIVEAPAGSYCRDNPDEPGNCQPVPFYAKTIRFTGVNVQIVNGAGATAEINGLGNLIVGYQEERRFFSPNTCFDDHRNDRGGSHNLIVGSRHNYPSFSCELIGDSNSCWAPYSCVAGGRFNIAGGRGSLIGGGEGNWALFDLSAVIGGRDNSVSDEIHVIVDAVGKKIGGADCGAE